MFKYKNIYLGLFYLVLSFIPTVNNASSTLEKTIFSTIKVESVTKVRAASLSEQFAPVPKPEYWGLARDRFHTNNTAIEAIAVAENESAEAAEANLKLVRRISLSCFLLLFVPLGIFYPLFLFYRRLLSHDYNIGYSGEDKSQFPDSANFAKDDTPSSNSIAVPSLREEKTVNSFLPLRGAKLGDRHHNSDSTASSSSNKPHRAKISSFSASAKITTVSKLQIAFSPQAATLRAKLSEVAASSECDRQLIGLLRQTISVLLTQQYWTHVSYSSDSLPKEKVRVEFDLVSHLERNKCLAKESSYLNRERHTPSFSDSHKDSYNYVVVTLILCTTHDSPLFDKIYTEAQLIEELVKLSQIENDRLLKFELLWNPQAEAEYISNEQLLTQYSDLTRIL